ncbi:hypothetical protein ACFL3G_13185 [Planctomycetota bacterium]
MKQKTVIILICMMLIGFTGCGPSTINALKANPVSRDTFDVNQPSLAVYRNIITNARDKYAGCFSLIVAGDYWQDTKNGQISYTITDIIMGVNRNVQFVIDIIYIDETHTKVKAYYGGYSNKRYAADIRQWCTGSIR